MQDLNNKMDLNLGKKQILIILGKTDPVFITFSGITARKSSFLNSNFIYLCLMEYDFPCGQVKTSVITYVPKV